MLCFIEITPFAARQLFRCAKYLLSVPLAGRHIIQHLFVVAKHNFYIIPLPPAHFLRSRFRPRISRPRCALLPRRACMMHTIRRSCMTAGTGYGLAPFFKVQNLKQLGLLMINREQISFLCIIRKNKFFRQTQDIARLT